MLDTETLDLVKNIFEFTNEVNEDSKKINEEVDQIFKRASGVIQTSRQLNQKVNKINQNLMRLENILKKTICENNLSKKTIQEATNFIKKPSVRDLFMDDDDENENKSYSESTNKKIKESPHKFIHSYFNNNNKTPVKSQSIFAKYPPVIISSENDENKSSHSKIQTKKNDKFKHKKSFDINNDIPSPRKQLNSSTNQQPRLKQLTMTQAFITQLNSPKKLNQSSSTTNLSASTANNNEVLKIKQSNSFYQENNNNSSNQSTKFKNLSNLVTSVKFDPDETCLPSVFNNVKSEPVDFEMTDQGSSNNLSSNVDSNKNNKQNKINFFENEYDSDYFLDFDKVPKKKTDSPNYKHAQVVRKHDERKKLGTSTCTQCENYWNSLPEDKRPARMDEMCRHRSKYQAPATPEHYWSIEFPTREECIERGYGGVITQNDDDPKLAKRPRRKRPLKLITKEKEDEDELDLDFDLENDDF